MRKSRTYWMMAMDAIGLTVQELARRSGDQPSAISNARSGVRALPIKARRSLSVALKAPMDLLDVEIPHERLKGLAEQIAKEATGAENEGRE